MIDLLRLPGFLAPLAEPGFRPVFLGIAALGGIAGAVGTFAVVRRQSLQGDAISHAALPGIVLAYLCGARSGAELAFGAALTGWLAMILATAIPRQTRIPADTALAGSLAAFFGVGLLLLSYLQKNRPDAVNHGLERYLFGRAAEIQAADLNTIYTLGFLAGLILWLGWKEFQLVSFDPEFAHTTGLPATLLDRLLTTLVVVATVIGLQAVGVVLMSALIVAPASAARQWSDRLGRVVLLAGMFGALAGAIGTTLAHALPGIPTGPMIVLVATLIFGLSALFAPRHGVLIRRFRASPRAPGES
jgi:manganese/zinc/iron transport system permease protein